MTTQKGHAPTSPRPPEARSPARGFSDLHCLWRFCGRRACTRARACRSEPAHCLPFLMLVPIEARAFLNHWDDALREGLTFEEMMDEHAEEWQALMQWRDLVRAASQPRRRERAASNREAAREALRGSSPAD